ncbi:MAG: radical SAM protein [Anaerolineae bacterium]|jgi:anaerobic ribonucleoside-triphosphate reductase activating protein|nr:radical SAM protein [Anaerolineae bacterium]
MKNIRNINVAHFVERTYSEGPGWRAALWVQGCSINCPGCINQDFIPFINREWVTVEALAKRVTQQKDIEGLTLLGGEPFAQAAALAELAAHVQEAGLSVMTFSGYTYEQLTNSANPSWHKLLAHTDLLAAGPFIQEQYTTQKPWVGSDNQTLHYLTPRYRHLETAHPRLNETNGVELRFTADGTIWLNGFAYTGLSEHLIQAMRENGFHLGDGKA